MTSNIEITNDANNEIIEISAEDLKQMKIERERVFRRNYYKILYNTNEKFREYKKTYNKNVYKDRLKTIKCTLCGHRVKYATLNSLVNYEYDKDNFKCMSCSVDLKEIITQIKNARGRHPKIIETSNIKTLE